MQKHKRLTEITIGSESKKEIEKFCNNLCNIELNSLFFLIGCCYEEGRRKRVSILVHFLKKLQKQPFSKPNIFFEHS